MVKYKLFFPFVFTSFVVSNIKGQYDFSKVDKWLDDNTSSIGDRSILLVYKDEQ